MPHIEALSQTKTRRALIKGAVGLGLSAVFINGRKEAAATTFLSPNQIPIHMTMPVPGGYRTLREIQPIGKELPQAKSEGFPEGKQTTEPTPFSLSDAFTSNVENINHLGKNQVNLVDTAHTENERGQVATMFALIDRRSVTANSSVQKLKLDQESEKYTPLEQKGDALMKMGGYIVTFTSDDIKLDKETVVIGGHDFDNRSWPWQWPVLSISKDGAETFNPVTITNEQNEDKFSGSIIDMKHIPYTENVITLMMHFDPPHLTYGILDAKKGDYYHVTGSKLTPLLDDLYVSPDNPRVLFGSGRIVEYVQDGTPYASAINDFELDLDKNIIIKSRTHHEDIPYLNDLHVLRSSDGRPEIGYAPRLITDGYGSILERAIYTIDMKKDSAGYSSFDYSFMDKKLVEEMDMGNELNRQIAQHRHTTVITHVCMAPQGNGNWITGFTLTDTGSRPLAAYLPVMDPTDIKDKMILYPFDHVRIFQSPIHKEPKFVKFYDPDQTETYGGFHGVMVSTPAAGPIFIRTDARYQPRNKEVLYTNRAPQPISAATPTPAQ